jgi:hypothetical protein
VLCVAHFYASYFYASPPSHVALLPYPYYPHFSLSPYAYLEASAFSSWEKCEQYYKYTDDSAAYYTAQVLPDKKWTWFQQEFEKDEEKKN